MLKPCEVAFESLWFGKIMCELLFEIIKEPKKFLFALNPYMFEIPEKFFVILRFSLLPLELKFSLGGNRD